MPLIQLLESWAEGLLRIAMGIGLAWIGAVEGGGYGLFFEVVGAIFVLAGLVEIWGVEAAALRQRRDAAPAQPPPIACDIPVFYASTHGQTRRIAERLVALFRERHFTSDAVDVASAAASRVDWRRAQAAIVGASLHGHRHQRAARAFADEHAPELNVRPSAFFSVSLAAASTKPEEHVEAERLARAFVDKAEWHATEVASIAGRLAYTQYGWVTRLVMKRIARQEGQPTDTSRDYEFTDWDEVARFADRIVAAIAAERAARQVAA